jgi:hypothetical protein
MIFFMISVVPERRKQYWPDWGPPGALTARPLTLPVIING